MSLSCHFVDSHLDTECTREWPRAGVQLLPAFHVLGTHLGLRMECPAYLMYPFHLPNYGQVIQGGTGGPFMSRHVHTDQVQVLRKELKTQTLTVSTPSTKTTKKPCLPMSLGRWLPPTSDLDSQ